MKKIIIGCPYGSLSPLESALKRAKNDADVILDTKDIGAFDFENIYTLDGNTHPIDSVTAAFIRYPYDLIPPHTETYNLREKTESLKSCALLFNKVSINKVADTFAARNRMWSLAVARKIGLHVPQSVVVSDPNFPIDTKIGETMVTKSLGNCYYADNVDEDPEAPREFLSFEEDDGESAYIYSPHTLERNEVGGHVEKFGICFVQDFIQKPEYRIFIVGTDLFVYEREAIKKVDKSSGGLMKASTALPRSESDKLLSLASNLNLNYLCLDAFWDAGTNRVIVIDINPFGSMPKYEQHPEVVDALSVLLLKP